jgi:hypothetical protein
MMLTLPALLSPGERVTVIHVNAAVTANAIKAPITAPMIAENNCFMMRDAA